MLAPLILTLAPCALQDAPAPRAVPKLGPPIPKVTLELEEASLAEACRALADASGLPVHARGAAGGPITLKLAGEPFWEATLALCEAAEVGLAPRTDQVLLGRAWKQPQAVADGAVLVSLTGAAKVGEREGELRVELRVLPGMQVVGARSPEWVTGRDYDG
ncbi:MAG: hypothetical protein O2816_17945 [Planctomycetota bacterium]|nr:hypothetical protein [Planctomycetota bacterium]